MEIFRQRHPCRGRKCRHFRPISCFISEMIQHTAIVTMECEQETVPKLAQVGRRTDERNVETLLSDAIGRE